MSTDSNSLDRRQFLATGASLAATGAILAKSANAAEPANKAPLRVAMLSGWHAHAKGYARALYDMPEVKLTCVWDELPERGQAWAKEMDLPFVDSIDKLLALPDVDAVACNAPSNMHAELMTAAAKAGKHIFTEKVMALTIDECNQIADAVRAAKVKFCISYPYRCRAAVLYAHKAVEDGLLGNITALRVRVAHDGGSANWLPPHFWDPVQCGGGAMMDLGAHPMYLSRWFCGKPTRISSTFNYITGHEVEDNAVSVIEFENKCIAVAETSFVSTHSPFTLEITGTEGTVVVGGPEQNKVQIRSNKLEKREWHSPETLPEPLPNPVRQWVLGILEDKPIAFGLEEGIQLTELMQYAYLAHKEKRQVEIPA